MSDCGPEGDHCGGFDCERCLLAGRAGRPTRRRAPRDPGGVRVVTVRLALDEDEHAVLAAWGEREFRTAAGQARWIVRTAIRAKSQTDPPPDDAGG